MASMKRRGGAVLSLLALRLAFFGQTGTRAAHPYGSEATVVTVVLSPVPCIDNCKCTNTSAVSATPLQCLCHCACNPIKIDTRNNPGSDSLSAFSVAVQLSARGSDGAHSSSSTTTTTTTSSGSAAANFSNVSVATPLEVWAGTWVGRGIYGTGVACAPRGNMTRAACTPEPFLSNPHACPLQETEGRNASGGGGGGGGGAAGGPLPSGYMRFSPVVAVSVSADKHDIRPPPRPLDANPCRHLRPDICATVTLALEPGHSGGGGGGGGDGGGGLPLLLGLGCGIVLVGCGVGMRRLSRQGKRGAAGAAGAPPSRRWGEEGGELAALSDALLPSIEEDVAKPPLPPSPPPPPPRPAGEPLVVSVSSSDALVRVPALLEEALWGSAGPAAAGEQQQQQQQQQQRVPGGCVSEELRPEWRLAFSDLQLDTQPLAHGAEAEVRAGRLTCHGALAVLFGDPAERALGGRPAVVRPVAVKRLLSVLAREPQPALVHEVCVLASLRSHPRVVALYGVALHLRSVYIVQELCVCSCRDLLRGGGRAAGLFEEGRAFPPPLPAKAKVEAKAAAGSEHSSRGGSGGSSSDSRDGRRARRERNSSDGAGAVHPSPHWCALAAEPARLLRLLLESAEGLAHVHASALVHRDVKPSNLLLDDRGGAKVADFGLARSLVGGNAARRVLLTAPVAQGTPFYMAPEVLLEEPFDERVDVFSWAVTAAELLGGRPLYEHCHTLDVPMGVAGGRLRPTLGDAVPRPLAELLRGCWSQEPAQRPAFREIVHRLRAVDPEALRPLLPAAAEQHPLILK